MFTNDRIQYIVYALIALAIAIPVHEFAHARSAVSNGDDGPRRAGRLSIAPWDHFDPIGAIFCAITVIAGFGLGWGKPVMVNPSVLHHPRWDMVKISAWGPFSNLLMAIGFGLPLRLGVSLDSSFGFFLMLCVFINLALMLFNLIPIYPLDGSKILEGFLPDHLALEYSRFMSRFGFLILMGLIFVFPGSLGQIIGPPMQTLAALILGPALG